MNGHFFRLTGLSCGEFTGDRWIPHIRASDAEPWCFRWPAPWINGWVNNGEAGDLRRHRARYDVIVMENLSAVDCFGAFNCNMRFTDIISDEIFFAGNNYGLPIILMTIWYHSDQSIRYKAIMIKGSFECQIRSVFARPHFMQISKRLDNKAVI